jgi:lysophospholipase L1-like esterase
MGGSRAAGKWLSRQVRSAVAAALFLASCSADVPVLPRLGPDDAILAFGDSLTYGTGAGAEESYPRVLSVLIGKPVIASGVPGETTAGGLDRIDEVLEEHQPKLLLLCLGGNDMLRKVSASTIEANLRSMVEIARARGVEVVLVAVPEPVLFGGNANFYRAIADDFSLPLENEALNDILRDNSLKSDQIHPNAEGYRRLAHALAELLREAGAI